MLYFKYMKSLFLLLKIVLAYTHPCIVFYTGGSNLMSTDLYSDFLSEINNIDVYKIPFNCNNKSGSPAQVINPATSDIVLKNFQKLIEKI